MMNAMALGILSALMLGASAATCGQDSSSSTVKSYAFDSADSLAGWTLAGDAALDPAKGRDGRGGSLKIGPKGAAILKLRDEDASGRVDFWIYDDGTKPHDPKTSRVGPRWGIVEGDGKLLAVGILYASYLGGDEGYTVTACDGKDWFNQLFWLGSSRAPAGWRKWSFVFDTEKGIRILRDDQDVNAGTPPQFDNALAGLNGFRSIAIWGDNGDGEGQTVWVDDVSVELGGPVKSVPKPRPTAPRVNGPNPWIPEDRTVPIYSKAHPPAAPKLADLPLQKSVSQYGITWTFERPVRIGHFINGDTYVVGPATVTAIDPKPLYGDQIPEIELDHMDLERLVAERVRNGFMLDPPAAMKLSYDSGVRNWFDPSLIGKLPVAMKPGDSLVSTISMPKGLVLKAQLRNEIERGAEDSSPIRTAAVLTCVAQPLPPDAFRPAFCDRSQKIYYSHNLQRDRLPKLPAAKSIPDVRLYERFTRRPWVGTGFFGFEEPVENMPQYGLEYGRVSGISALLLCSNLSPAQKEPLLVNYVQIGIDLGGVIRAGHPGWTGWGGHGSGRKLPIVFAGLLLGDESLANVNRAFPKASFGEDEQTAYGDAWTGAKVVFAGHSGIDATTGEGRSRGNGWGPYEHTPPSQWGDGQKTSESYRRCCTSVGWVAEALTLRLLHAEKEWDHPAFLDYVDRWMFENDGEFIKTIKTATGQDFSPEWARQGQTWDDFVNEMWEKYRKTNSAPIDSWKTPRDESYYKSAIERMK